MAVRLRQNNLKLSGAVTGALIIGGGFLLFRTFPHLKAIFNAGSTDSSGDLEDDNTPVPLDGEFVNLESQNSGHKSISLEEIHNLNDDSIKSILVEKDINPPSNATHDELVAILKSSK